MFSVLVLAAGMGRRMGSLKPLTYVNGRFMIQAVLEKYLQDFCGELVVAVGFEREKVEAAVGVADPRVRTVFNPVYEMGMGTSVAAGVRALSPDSEGFMLALCDMPAVGERTVAELFRFWTEDRSRIVIPLCGGRKGHPVIFPRSLYGQLSRLCRDRGASSVVRANEALLSLYETGDWGVLMDADTSAEAEVLGKFMREGEKGDD